MKNIIIGLVALASFSVLAQNMEIRVANPIYPDEPVHISCLDENCDELRLEYFQVNRFVHRVIKKENILKLSKTKVKIVSPYEPFELVKRSKNIAKTNFNERNYGRALGNSVVTVLAIIPDLAALPVEGTGYLFGSYSGRDEKKGAIKILKLLENNEPVEIKMNRVRFEKFMMAVTRL